MYSIFVETPDASFKEKVNRIINKVVIPRKKLIFVLASVFLAVLSLLLIALIYSSQKQISTSTKPKAYNVNPKKEYENPFQTGAQYVNPFSDYKNPFDSLIQ